MSLFGLQIEVISFAMLWPHQEVVLYLHLRTVSPWVKSLCVHQRHPWLHWRRQLSLPHLSYVSQSQIFRSTSSNTQARCLALLEKICVFVQHSKKMFSSAENIIIVMIWTVVWTFAASRRVALVSFFGLMSKEPFCAMHWLQMAEYLSPLLLWAYLCLNWVILNSLG